jgi:hypothetical protein
LPAWSADAVVAVANIAKPALPAVRKSRRFIGIIAFVKVLYARNKITRNIILENCPVAMRFGDKAIGLHSP